MAKKNLRTSLVMKQKNTPSVDYNYWLKRLDNQLNEPANHNLIKVPKVVELTNKKNVITKL